MADRHRRREAEADPITRTAGDGRYARVEREQRWVLSEVPAAVTDPVAITDLYLPGTRLRLRRMEAGPTTVYKLGQKVRPDPQDPETVRLTNLYLSREEYETVAALGGAEVRKTRWRWRPAQRTLAVDEFAGALVGLVLAEVELDPQEPRMASPPSAIADVTDDDRFSGGTLATTSADALSVLRAGLDRPG